MKLRQKCSKNKKSYKRILKLRSKKKLIKLLRSRRKEILENLSSQIFSVNQGKCCQEYLIKEAMPVALKRLIFQMKLSKKLKICKQRSKKRK